MCLLSSESPTGYSCVCPDGFVPSESGATCSSKAKSNIILLRMILYLQLKYTQCAQIILLYVKILIAFHYSGNVMVLMIVEITVMKITATQVNNNW